MITARTLQFDSECAQILDAADTAAREGRTEDAKRLRAEWASTVQTAMDETLRTRGFELVLAGMRAVVALALHRISLNESPEYNAGKISAIEDIRARLRELTKSQELLDAYDEGL